MIMTRREIQNHENELSIVLQLEFELNSKIVYSARRTKNNLSSKATETKELLDDLRKLEQKLDLKYCNRDKYEKPIITQIFQIDKDGNKVLAGEHYSGLEVGNNPEYDTEKEKIINSRKEILNEEIDVKLFTFKEELMPKKGPMNILSALCFLIADNSE